MVGWLFHDAWMWLQEEDEHDHIASDRDGKTEEEKEERERNHVKYGLIGGATRNEMRTSSVHKQDLRPEACIPHFGRWSSQSDVVCLKSNPAAGANSRGGWPVSMTLATG